MYVVKNEHEIKLTCLFSFGPFMNTTCYFFCCFQLPLMYWWNPPPLSAHPFTTIKSGEWFQCSSQAIPMIKSSIRMECGASSTNAQTIELQLKQTVLFHIFDKSWTCVKLYDWKLAKFYQKLNATINKTVLYFSCSYSLLHEIRTISVHCIKRTFGLALPIRYLKWNKQNSKLINLLQS